MKRVFIYRSGVKLGLPKFCECGGHMLYDFDFDRVWSACDTCTPVVEVRLTKRAVGGWMPENRATPNAKPQSKPKTR